MLSDDQAAANLIFAKNEQSHLLKLPPEIRLAIYGYVLAPDDTCVISKASKPRRPGLLQACRRLRNESSLLYHELNTFHVTLDLLQIDSVRRWAATITSDELRKIQLISFEFDFVPRLSVSDFFDPCNSVYDEFFISDYEEIVASILHRGLATTAVRITDLLLTEFTVEGFLYDDDTDYPKDCLIYASSADEETLRVRPDTKPWEGKHDSAGYMARMAAKCESGWVQRKEKVKHVVGDHW